MLYEKLIAWKESENRKPLVLKGVRQCGKTFLLREFGGKNYRDVAYFNFEGNAALRERFASDLDVRRIVAELSILRNRKIDPAETLLIFDEVQFCNEALTSLKYFCEDMPEQHVVCAGSLLGVALSKPLSFPVGKVSFLTLRPMNFFEFLLAHDEDMLCDHLKAIPPDEKISDLLVPKLELYYRDYIITGGMPEAVSRWIETRDAAAVEEVQSGILGGYELDFAKHAPVKDFPKLSMIWNAIPEQLAKENQKFIFSRVKRGLRSKDLEDALEWLVAAGLVFKVEKISKPGLPLSAYADRSYFKLYTADTGLLRRMAKLPARAVLEGSRAYAEFKGALTENYVLCELMALRDEIPYYWKSENIAEVDFIARFGMDVVPIEVKSERNTKSKSLAAYRKQHGPRLSIKASMEKTEITKKQGGTDVKSVPLYMLWRIEDYVTG